MSAPRPRVYNIPQGIPFVDALAAGLLSRHGHDPLALSRVRVFLPTRRAVRALGTAFLRRGAGRALLLPVMAPLGDADEDELELTLPQGLDLPPAIPDLDRRLLLSHLIRRRPGFEDAAQAIHLAGELARFLDAVAIEGCDFNRLKDLVPGDYAEHWQITLAFLTIITEHWPKILEAEQVIDPGERRNRLIGALSESLSVTAGDGPVYAAGSTGSIPATAALIKTIASLPEGAVVLSGFDAEMDDMSYAALSQAPTHPQHALHALLHVLRVGRDEIEPWPLAPDLGALDRARRAARTALIRDTLRPAATSDAWGNTKGNAAAATDPLALDGLELLEAPAPREEAAAIALILRQVLEMPDQTAALVTPDRNLARRVAAELGRFGIAIDDSAGTPLHETPPGTFLRLLLAWLADGGAPVPLLAALKHPFACGGRSRSEFLRHLRGFEIVALRGPRPGSGLEGLIDALSGAERRGGLGRWLAALTAKAAPLAEMLQAPAVDLADFVMRFLGFAEWLATGPDGAALWRGEAGQALADFVADLTTAAPRAEPLPGVSWVAVIETLMAERVVRPAYGRHPRLAIWGPLEARLQQADLLILGGLNEGTWPANRAADPWLSRPMRARFGLSPPERRIGQAAHDFAQAVAARRVVLTRATKVDGTPTVASRWMQRLQALVASAGRALPVPSALFWQEALDRPARVMPVIPPAPRPPLAARPRRLSVTEVETWIRNPYAIYARCVLKLEPLAPLDADPDAAERGNFIHTALDRFLRENAGDLPADAYERLLAIGREVFRPRFTHPGVNAFWWPRFAEIARWFLAFEQAERRAKGWMPLLTEVRGGLRLDLPAGPFTLSAKADRIDRDEQGALAILDYKTGALPRDDDVAAGLAPQLPLEAAIALAGGFEGLAPADVTELAFVRLKGARAAPGEFRAVRGEAKRLAENAMAGLKSLILRFDDPKMPYRARPRPQFVLYDSDYDHLARVKEWAGGGGAT